MRRAPGLALLGGIVLPACGGSPEAYGLSARLHPDLGSLLYVSWTQDQPARGRVGTLLDGEWRYAPERDYPAGENEQLVLGLPYGEAVVLRVELEGPGGFSPSDEELDFETGELPEGFPVPELLLDEESLRDPAANYLLGSVNADDCGWCPGRYWRFVLDRQARPVWVEATPDNHWTLEFQPSLDGNSLLWDEATYWAEFDGGAGSRVHRSTLDGTELAVYPTPGLHHAFVELPGGLLAWGAARGADEVLLVGPAGGESEALWDCQDFQEEIGYEPPVQELAGGAWGGAFNAASCQSNSLYWSEERGSFLYSFYTSSGVVEIDAETGESLRWFGANYPGAYGFDPPESAFHWQHGVSFTEAGTLLLSTYVEEDVDELVVREYELDDEAHLLHQVWSAGLDQHIEGRTNGEAHRLPGGNTLRNYGSGGRVQELAPDGTVVWDVDFGPGHLLGRTVYLEDLYAFAEPSGD